LQRFIFIIEDYFEGFVVNMFDGNYSGIENKWAELYSQCFGETD
jgi:hypothetical protein